MGLIHSVEWIWQKENHECKVFEELTVTSQYVLIKYLYTPARIILYKHDVK